MEIIFLNEIYGGDKKLFFVLHVFMLEATRYLMETAIGLGLEFGYSVFFAQKNRPM